MATASIHTNDDDRPGLVLIYDRGSHRHQRHPGTDDSSQVASACPFTTRLETTEGGFIHRSKTLQSNLSIIGEHIETQWGEDDYGFLTGEGKKWATISLLDDDDDDDDDNCLGIDYNSPEGCGAQTAETCVFVCKLLPHFLYYFMC